MQGATPATPFACLREEQEPRSSPDLSCTSRNPPPPPLPSGSVSAAYQVAAALVSTSAYPCIEEEEDGTFDQIENPQDFALIDPSEEAVIEETKPDDKDVPGLPIQEADRRA